MMFCKNMHSYRLLPVLLLILSSTTIFPGALVQQSSPSNRCLSAVKGWWQERTFKEKCVYGGAFVGVTAAVGAGSYVAWQHCHNRKVGINWIDGLLEKQKNARKDSLDLLKEDLISKKGEANPVGLSEFAQAVLGYEGDNFDDQLQTMIGGRSVSHNELKGWVQEAFVQLNAIPASDASKAHQHLFSLSVTKTLTSADWEEVFSAMPFAEQLRTKINEFMKEQAPDVNAASKSDSDDEEEAEDGEDGEAQSKTASSSSSSSSSSLNIEQHCAASSPSSLSSTDKSIAEIKRIFRSGAGLLVELLLNHNGNDVADLNNKFRTLAEVVEKSRDRKMDFDDIKGWIKDAIIKLSILAEADASLAYRNLFSLNCVAEILSNEPINLWYWDAIIEETPGAHALHRMIRGEKKKARTRRLSQCEISSDNDDVPSSGSDDNSDDEDEDAESGGDEELSDDEGEESDDSEESEDDNTLSKDEDLLHQACLTSDLSTVARLLANRVSIEAPNPYGLTPLHLACQVGAAQDLVAFLIEEGADREASIPGQINNVGYEGWRPLHTACSPGYAVRALLEAGVDIEAEALDGRRPLHVACRACSLESVQLLMSKGADTEAKMDGGMRPLHMACQTPGDGLKVIKPLIEDAKVDKEAKADNDWTPFHFACDTGHRHVIAYLISQGVDRYAKDNEGRTPFDLVYSSGKTELIAWIKQYDTAAAASSTDDIIYERFQHSSPSDSLEVRLRKACCHGLLDEVEALMSETDLDKEAPDAQGRTALYIACNTGSLPVVKHLIANGCSTAVKTNKGLTPLHEACIRGYLPIIKLLVEVGGADIEATTDDRLTPLHCACTRHFYPVVEYLVSSDANRWAKDKNGLTPYDYAVRDNPVFLAPHLAKKLGMDINPNEVSNDSIAASSTSSHPEDDSAVEQLTDQAASSSSSTGDEEEKSQASSSVSPEILLHEACIKGDLAAVKELIEAGADKEATASESGLTPLQIASMRGHRDVMAYLVEQGVTGWVYNQRDGYAAASFPLRVYEGSRSELPSGHSANATKSAETESPAGDLAGAATASVAYQEPVWIDSSKKQMQSQEASSSSSSTDEALSTKATSSEPVIIADASNTSSSGEDEECDKDSSNEDNETSCEDSSDDGEECEKSDAEEAEASSEIRNLFIDPCQGGDLTTVKTLVLLGYDKHVVDADGRTALHIACLHGHDDIVNYLLSEDFVVDVRDYQGDTPLHRACAQGHLAVVQTLLKSGADKNARNNRDETPLYVACDWGNTDVVKELLNAGANTQIRTLRGRTPFYVASKNEYNDIVNLLREHGSLKNPFEADGNHFGQFGTFLVLSTKDAIKHKFKQLLDDQWIAFNEPQIIKEGLKKTFEQLSKYAETLDLGLDGLYDKLFLLCSAYEFSEMDWTEVINNNTRFSAQERIVAYVAKSKQQAKAASSVADTSTSVASDDGTPEVTDAGSSDAGNEEEQITASSSTPWLNAVATLAEQSNGESDSSSSAAVITGVLLQSQASSSSSNETALKNAENDAAGVEAENERMLREELAEWNSEDLADKEKIDIVLKQFDVTASEAFSFFLKAPAFSQMDKDAQERLLRFLFSQGIDPFAELKDGFINNFVLYCEICNPEPIVVGQVILAAKICGHNLQEGLEKTLRALLLSKDNSYGKKALNALVTLQLPEMLFGNLIHLINLSQLLLDTEAEADEERWKKVNSIFDSDY